MSELADQYNAEVVRRLQAEAERDAIARQYDDNLSRLRNAEQQLGRCTCDPTPMSCGGEGPSETCGVHGRTYAEWVERGDILNARLVAVKEVLAKVRQTPAANDPYHVALDIADDLEAAVYLGAWPPDHGKVLGIEELRAALTGPPSPTECCASGRCEVCAPGYDWGRDG